MNYSFTIHQFLLNKHQHYTADFTIKCNLMIKVLFLVIINCFILLSVPAFSATSLINENDVDFIHYRAELTPNFQKKSILGQVTIKFAVKRQNLKQLIFSAKYMQIHSVLLNNTPIHYQVENEQLLIAFKQPATINKNQLLTVNYSTAPKRGVKFYSDHLFTVYHTKYWLIAHDDIADKATFELLLHHDTEVTSQGNGRLLSNKQTAEQQTTSHWQQNTPIPIYTFGFALGKFAIARENIAGNQFSYLYRKSSPAHISDKVIKFAFNDVGDMLTFFEEKAGYALPQQSYSYVVVDGFMAQEAAGFSLVGEKFVSTVLENKHENWFIAHELAHEWWGNSITCKSFSHFWLNEGLVQFLVAAYKEHLFGKEAYLKEIAVAITRVQHAVANNKVAPVAFKYKITEADINRTMAYSKGALIFYLLRQQLGDEVFWQALKVYSQTYRNNSVTTAQLQQVFEQVSKKDLSQFFERWVYGNDIPHIELKK